MITLKSDVVRLHPMARMVLALATFEGFPIVITSGRDSVHGIGSLHYDYLALDVRIHGLTPEQVNLLRNYLHTFLGPNYDIIIEAAGTSNEHMHVEFDAR